MLSDIRTVIPGRTRLAGAGALVGAACLHAAEMTTAPINSQRSACIA
jgi:hypothetical protein